MRWGVLLIMLLGGCHVVYPFETRDVDGPAPLEGGHQDGPVDGASGLLDGEADAGGPAVVGRWVTVQGDTFTMGSPETEACREPAVGARETPHQVTLAGAFEIWSTEVTQGEFESLMGYDPSSQFSADCDSRCPVESVTWHEAAAYCNALSDHAGHELCYECSGSQKNTDCTTADPFGNGQIYACPGYRLPTEAEWELAYRAGTATAYYSGSLTPGLCGDCATEDAALGAIAWYCANSTINGRPAGQKAPNARGLYDMSGNVLEWCHDRLTEDLGYAAATNPWGQDATSTERVLRGGCRSNNASLQRAAFRRGGLPGQAGPCNGFRCVRSLDP